MKKAAAAGASALKHGIEACAMMTTAPFAAWVTVGHRLPLIIEAMTGSTNVNDPELTRMVREKLQATEKAGAAMTQAVFAGQQALTGYALAEMTANLALFTSSPAKSSELQAHVEQSVRRFARLTATLSEIGAKSVSSGMRPAHKKVTANAKRLGKKGR